MYSRALFLTFILDLIVTVNPIPRPDVGLFALDDESLTIPASDEQTFDISSPVEVSDSGTDLFSLEDCSDNANIPGPFWDDALQARGNTCSNAPPETKSSADGENTNNSGESGNSPSSEKLNSDLYDNSFQPDNDPLKHTFSLPQDYDDERCREFGFIRYAVCSSGDYRDEARSTAYNFFPVQAYRLSRCSFMFNKYSICFYPGKIWCCVVYSEIGYFPIADGCLEVLALPGGLDGSLFRSPFL